MKEILRAVNVGKIYNHGSDHQVEALKAVDLRIDPGEFIVVMGPSGAGKSTLLSVLTTILPPTSGEVYIDGCNINEMNEEEKSQFRYKELGFVYQNYNMISSLTIYENIALPLSLAKENKKVIHEKVVSTAKRLGIEDLLDKYPNECSGGEQQRTAIARTLATSPKLIVADEPTGNLDSNYSHEIMELLSDLNKEGTTLLLVTHDSTIASYGNRLLYINDGVIEAEIHKLNKSKKEYFDEIIGINSKESFFDDEED